MASPGGGQGGLVTSPYEEAEGNVLRSLRRGELAAIGGDDAAKKKGTLSAQFIRELCTDPELAKDLTPHGVHISGYTIDGLLDLNSRVIPFSVSLTGCSVTDAIDLRHCTIPALDLSGTRTKRIDADSLTVAADLRLANGFSARGPVCLTGATIHGDLSCVRGHFDNGGGPMNRPGVSVCGDCRAHALNAYALVLERAKVDGSVFLCDDFRSSGGVHLGDATIGVNLNCTKGTFVARTRAENRGEARNGRRLACEADAGHNFSCGFNGEGMHVKGNLIMYEIKVTGETRLTGAQVEGDLDSARGHYDNEGGNAIHGDRLHVHGNVFFCDAFDAKGTIRLPRAQIGADLSFFNACLTSAPGDSRLLYCEGIQVQGTLFMIGFQALDGYVDLSYSTFGGNLNCAGSRLENPGGWALKAKGMEVKGTVLFTSRDNDTFQAHGLVSLTGSKLGMDLICTDGEFTSRVIFEPEDEVPWAIKADNMSISGRVEMNGARFIAQGGVSFDYTKIGSYLDCEHGKFYGPELAGKDNFAISGGKLQTDGSIYLNNGFEAKGCVMLNDASIGRNLDCSRGSISNEGDKTLWARQMRVTGSVILEGFTSTGQVLMNNTVIGGDLKCLGGNFCNQGGQGDPRTTVAESKRYALCANGLRVAGNAAFDEIHADGIVSLQNATVAMALSWKKIRGKRSAALFLDSSKVDVLDDEEASWPDPQNLQINGFEYQFLRELGALGLKSRRKRWLALSRDFRIQPYEHLAAVLKRNGYENDAVEVLIEMNRAQTALPVVWPWSAWLHRKCAPESRPVQSQGFLTRLARVCLSALVCYGYRPRQAVLWGLIFVLFGWLLFFIGFASDVMVPTGNDGSYVYQTAALQSPQAGGKAAPEAEKVPHNIGKGRGLYSLVYTLETFVPVIKLQVADHWLPTAYAPNGAANGTGLGLALCLYRWFLIVSGWVISIFYAAAIGGLVRR